MAKKYIDAERLKEGLKELESVIHSEQLVGQSMHPYDCGQLHAINIIKELINPLQQEQPCNRAIYLDVLFSNMKRNEAIKQLEYLNKVYGEQPCDTCTNDKGCVTCKDGELWEGKEQPCGGYDEAYLNEKIAKASKTWEGVDVDKYMAEMRGYEQPSEDFENEYEKFRLAGPDDDINDNYTFPIDLADYKDFARHFYILGLKNNIPVTQITLDELAKEGEPVSKDLKVAAEEYRRKSFKKSVIPQIDGPVSEYGGDIKGAFKAGAKWMREQMGEQARKELAKTDITLADLVAFDEGLKLGRRLERQDMLKDAVEGIVVGVYPLKRATEIQYGVLYPKGVLPHKNSDKVKIVIVPIKEDKK